MTRRIALEDILRIRTVSNAQISPDGRRIAFTVRTAALEDWAYASHLWIAEISGGGGSPFTAGKVSDSGHRWSPDGRRLAFSRTIDGASQAHVISASGGESRPLTALEAGSIGSLDWSPDGRRLAFVYRRSPRFQSKDPKIPVARRITDVWYKAETLGYWDGSFAQVHVADLDGRCAPVTDESNSVGEVRWSPDGAWLAFSISRGPGGETEISVMRPDGGGRRRLNKPDGPAGGLSWSPDSRSLAYLGHDHPEETWGSRNTHVWVAPLEGAARDAVPGFDRTCDDVTINDLKPASGGGQAPAWSPDGKSIFFLASDRGSTNIHRVTGGKVERVTDLPVEVMNFTIDPSGRVGAAAVSSPLMPGEIFKLDVASGRLDQASDVNRDLMGGMEISEPEELELPGGAQGWILKPPDFDASKKHPMALEIHGGPRTQYGHAFFHEFQLLAALGYAVLYTNPRGSQGYGEAFARSIRGDWGNLDYQDLMAAVDRALKLGSIDERRLAVLGGSYGGYMTSWIIGHTDRFRAAVSMRSVNNWVSFAGTSDIAKESFSEALAHPWEGVEKLWAMSPLAHVKNVRTPLLILHSAGDLRCPLEQAEQMFTALKLLGRTVEMVVFPEENHDLSRAGRPDRRLERLRHIVRWLQTHVSSAGGNRVDAHGV